MRPESGDRAYLWDIATYASRVETALAGRTIDEFLVDTSLQMAVERGLEVIGEAARLSPAIREQHREIEWRAIIGLRNVLAHEYTRLDHSRIWRIATVDLPALRDSLRPIMDELEDQ